MAITIYIAIYGAMLSTAVAVWSVYQWWRSGARLSGRVSINMTGYGHMAGLNETYVLLTVSNRGKAATTITHVFTERYPDRFTSLFRRKPKQTLVLGRLPPFPVPFKLDPGNEFASVMIQDPEVEEWSRTRRLYFCVHHTMADRPVRTRIPAIVNQK